MEGVKLSDKVMKYHFDDAEVGNSISEKNSDRAFKAFHNSVKLPEDEESAS